MTKYELINEIAKNLTVTPVDGDTWEIKSTISIPRIDNDPLVITLTEITHDEQDYTGIFDGNAYNRLCGYDDEDEIDAAAHEDGMWTRDYQHMIWADTTNEDNYEPVSIRNQRLAERLYEEYINTHVEFNTFNITQ